MIEVVQADALHLPLADRSVDLVFASPPYEDARLYGELEFNARGDEWVNWAVPRFLECLRVCRGLVAWVVNGRTRRFRWSATPILLMAKLHLAGVHLRKPPIFHRVGIPGSGGPDWLRDDHEYVICATNGGKLPWSDNTAMGHPPKYAAGGASSNRRTDGSRVNRCKPASYAKPAIANPGNVITRKVGGGHMGHPLAHETESPFPESLAEFFVRSFCPPDGVVLDCFGGSGTTAAAALKAGRSAVSVDIRASQCDLTTRRLSGGSKGVFPLDA